MAEEETQVKEGDPVCGMTVDPSRTTHRAEHAGKTYYFCAPGCKKTFDADPEKYLTGANKGGKSNGNS